MLLSSALILALAAFVSAQVSINGVHQPIALSRQEKNSIPTYSLPPFDNLLLAAEEEYENARNSLRDPRVTRPYVFGKVVDTENFNFFDRAESRELDDGSFVFRLAFKSDNAWSLGLNFEEFFLVPGVEFYVHNDDLILGAYTAEKNNKETRTFAVQPLPGSFAILELYVPRYAVSYLSDASIRVSSVVHAYRNPYSVLASGSCNLDVACKGAGYEDQIRGVGMLLSAKGSAFCSGSLVNNAKGDGRQLFLTAYHCLSGSNPSDNIVMFKYEKEACGSSTAPRTFTVQGLKSLASYSSSDFHILEIVERIPDSYNVFLNGFSLSNTLPSSGFGIHHPSGDVKKISFVDTPLKLTCWDECSKQYHFQVPAWTQGTTEPGSSGSPLFDGKSKRIIGQLHGGSASCSNIKGYDSYGGVFASWEGDGSNAAKRLKDVLDPESTLARAGLSGVDGVNLNTARKGFSVNAQDA